MFVEGLKNEKKKSLIILCVQVVETLCLSHYLIPMEGIRNFLT